jgi:hypothetical protein
MGMQWPGRGGGRGECVHWYTMTNEGGSACGNLSGFRGMTAVMAGRGRRDRPCLARGVAGVQGPPPAALAAALGGPPQAPPAMVQGRALAPEVA